MKREDLDKDRVYQCSTNIRDYNGGPTAYGNRATVGLCKVVEIPNSGQEVLVRCVNGRLEPVGKTIAAPLSNIRIAGEYDIERAIRETQIMEANQAWKKIAKGVKTDYNRLVRALKIPSAKVEMADDLPYSLRYQKGPVIKPEDVTREMVEATVKIEIKGMELAKAAGRMAKKS
jgi:hypothetical protein